MRVRATDPRPCPKCGKIYRSAHTLRTHLEDKHTVCPGYVTYFICLLYYIILIGYSLFLFNRNKNLKKNNIILFSEHNKINITRYKLDALIKYGLSFSRYRCVLCGTVAKSRNSLHSHMSRQHRGISTKDLPVLPMPSPFDPELASKLLAKAGVKVSLQPF